MRFNRRQILQTSIAAGDNPGKWNASLSHARTRGSGHEKIDNSFFVVCKTIGIKFSQMVTSRGVFQALCD